VSAKTLFFVCGKCGFKNAPRSNAVPTLLRAPDGRYDQVDGNERCEQCGTANVEHDQSRDYEPGT
jgi:ribosomal protein S27AE